MADLNLREGSREPITLTLTRAGVAYDLTGKAVRLRRRDGKGNEDMFSTTDVSPLLVVTTPASGILTFTPGATTWGNVNAAGSYKFYVEVEVSSGVWYAWEESDNKEVKISDAFLAVTP
jgi:hypothetical protein